MKIRRTLAVSALGLGVALGPAAASWAASYPPSQPAAGEQGVSPSDRDDTVAGGTLPRTGGGIALAGAAGAALVGGGAVLVGLGRRRSTTD